MIKFSQEKILLLHQLIAQETGGDAAGKEPELISVDKSIPQREYFCFHDYEYYLDVSAFCEMIGDTVPLQEGLREEYEWYKQNPDSVYFKRPYIDYIESNLA